MKKLYINICKKYNKYIVNYKNLSKLKKQLYKPKNYLVNKLIFFKSSPALF